VTAVPAPADYQTGDFTGVSCTSASFCNAVGYYTSTTNAIELPAETWNGTSWSIQAVPGGKISLGSVSCPTAGSCAALAQYADVTPAPAVYSWTTAGGWVAGTAATPSAATFTGLGAISCLSATRCTAAGYYSVAAGGIGHGKPVAEQE
jgi:hypothetical protein